jgi:hypothetical protein
MNVQRRTYAAAGWLFRRLLGVTYLLAFWSLWRQVTGLIGAHGILPARAFMDAARAWAAAQQIGLDRFRVLPTLCWISTTDTFLIGLCIAGMILSAMLIVGLAPAIILPLLWLGYLSLSVVGQDFLSFQWDALLLETGFLAMFIAPARWLDRLRGADDVPRLGRWLMLWLLFRLMLGSGAMKLASGDPTWRTFTALSYHYETQPIPTPAAWFAHHFPSMVQRASTAAVLGLELFAPFLIAGPRRLRLVACGLLAGLQGAIALTGNYAFFNLLSAVLCLFLIDDEMLRFSLRARQPHRLRRAMLIVVAAITLPATIVAFAAGVGIRAPGWPLAEPIAAAIAPLRAANTYGLFSVMTTTRPEIVLEGSDDGVEWKEYGFKYKAGDVLRRPPWVAPHQPRLDWQMWFAALGSYETEPWFRSFCERLLEASPDVLALMDDDPFNGRPPRMLRAVLYRYRFSDPATRRDSGAWWTRERIGLYFNSSRTS